MIELINAGKFYYTEFGKHWIFRDVTLTLGFDKSVAVIGPNGAGKSTFLRLIAGADIPSEGQIIRTGRISPPMGLTPSIQAALSGAENARFAGRIYGLSRDEIDDLIDTVRETSDIGQYFDMPVANYSAGMRQRVSFAINISLHFDFYIFDEITAAGDREFRKFSTAKVRERLETSKFIIASHRTDELIDLCDAAILIADGQLRYFDDVEEALDTYRVDDDDEASDTRKRRRSRRRPRGAEDEVQGGDPPSAQHAADRSARISRIRELRELLQAEARDRQRGAAEGDVPASPPEDRPDPADQDAARRQRMFDIRKRLTDIRRSEPASAQDPAEAQALRDELAALKAERHGQAPGQSDVISGDSPHTEAVETATDADTAAASDHQRSIREVRARLAELRRKAGDSPDSEPEIAVLRDTLRQLLADRTAASGERSASDDPGSPDPAPVESPAEVTAAAEAPPDENQTPPSAQSALPKWRQKQIAVLAERRSKRRTQRQEEAGPADSNDHLPVNPGDTAPTDGEPPTVVVAPPMVSQMATEPSRGDPTALLRLALLRQDRAQAKAARAMRLLLQHLDGAAPAEGSVAQQGRLSLIAAAQDSAAAEAAQVRSLLDAGLFPDKTTPAADSGMPLRQMKGGA